MHMKISARWRFMGRAAFGFQLSGILSTEKKKIEDGLPRLVVLFFFSCQWFLKMYLSIKAVPVGPWREREGRIMRAHTACKEFRHPQRALNPLHHRHVCSFWKQHPDNRTPPSSDRCLAWTVKSLLWSNLKAGASESRRGLKICKYTSIFKPD